MRRESPSKEQRLIVYIDTVYRHNLYSQKQFDNCNNIKYSLTAISDSTKYSTSDIMSTQKREVQLKAGISSTISENDQGAMNMSPATSEKISPKDTKVKKSNKTCAFFQRTWKAMKKPFQKNRVELIVVPAEPDPDSLCVPESEVDLVDAEQLCLPGPSGPKTTTESTKKREVQLKAETSNTISENGNDQGAINMSPATTEKTSPKVRKISKSFAFFRRRWKAVKKSFQKNRVEPINISAESDPEPLCVPDPELQPEVDLFDAEQSCIPAPSAPGPQVTTKTEDTQVTTGSSSHKDFLVIIFQLERRMCKCRALWTPVTEVWPNVFIGDEETAMDKAKLKEMGITHLLNTVAYKEYLQGSIDTRVEYYKDMDITYYSVLINEEHRFDISKDLLPASEFIHKTLSNAENKLLIHCIDGVSRSATFVLAYLMIYHKILLEDAIDHIIDRRYIRPDRDFLKQLITLSSNLKSSIFPKAEHQVKTELSRLQMYIPQSARQLQDRLEQCTLDWTPVTEVWCNVFIGNEKTAMNRAKLKEMGVTHILNATASEGDLNGISIQRRKYYQGTSITYYNVPAVDKYWFDISKYFFPAAQFIHKALSNPENKVLVHCMLGVSRSSTLVLAYLMIYHNMTLEDAIDRITDVRWIEPNMGFLNQLTELNSDLTRERKLQLREELDIYKKMKVKPVPEPLCVPHQKISHTYSGIYEDSP